MATSVTDSPPVYLPLKAIRWASLSFWTTSDQPQGFQERARRAHSEGLVPFGTASSTMHWEQMQQHKTAGHFP